MEKHDVRIVKGIEVNRALLHHKPIRPIDIIYARIILEFAGATASFLLLFAVLIAIGICQIPADLLTMILGYFLVVWFSFNFVMIMAALSELSETIERVSHIILYFMLPFCGAFIPTYLIPGQAGYLLSYFPLVSAVEYFRHGYYGARMPAIYQMDSTLALLSFLTLFALTIMKIAIRRVQLN